MSKSHRSPSPSSSVPSSAQQSPGGFTQPGGNQFAQSQLDASDREGGGGVLGAIGSGLDWLGDRIGDGLDLRDDEERLDAEEELAEFRSRTYSVSNHHPPTGRGLFDASYDPNGGRLTISVRIHFNFQNGDPTSADWLNDSSGAVYPAEAFVWTDEEKEAYRNNTISAVQGAWSDQYSFHNTRRYWESLPTVYVAVQVLTTDDPANAHYNITVRKWPEADIGTTSVTPPGNSNNHSVGEFNESTADGDAGRPDVSHFRRTTSTRAAYGAADAANPGTILFALGSSEVGVADQARLRAFGAVLGGAAMPPFDVDVVGHASTKGTEADNQRLSDDRAREVSNLIVSGGAKKQPRVRGEGERGATDDPSWQRVDITVGSFQADQTTVIHEFGHIFGLADEYPAADGSGSREVGQEVAHSDLAERLIPGQAPVLAHHSENVMSNGEQILPHHYVTFLEVLGTMTNTTGQWAIGPGGGLVGPGDFPTPSTTTAFA